MKALEAKINRKINPPKGALMKTKRQMDEINARNPSPELYNIASLNMKEIPLDRSGKKQFPERPL